MDVDIKNKLILFYFHLSLIHLITTFGQKKLNTNLDNEMLIIKFFLRKGNNLLEKR